MKALEREMKVALFHRDSRHVELTAPGLVFLEDARTILVKLSDAVVRAQAASCGLEGNLRVGYIKGYERSDLPRMLSDFHSHYPNVQLSFLRENVAELYDALRAERVDLVINILYDTSEMQDIEHQILHSYQLDVVVSDSSPLADREKVAMSDLMGYPLIDIYRGSGGYGENSRIAQTLTEIGEDPTVAYVSEDVETSMLAVAAGMGYALLPRYFTASIGPEDGIIRLPIDGKENEMKICAAWLPHHKNELLDVFLDEFLYVDGSK